MATVLDPFLFPNQLGRIKLSGNPLPGIVVSIEGAERPYEWQVQKGQGTSGAQSVYKGEQIAESIKIVLAGTQVGDFQALADLRAVIAPPKGGKPPSFTIEHPMINFNGITRVSIKKIGQPAMTKGKHVTLELEFIEFNPPAPAANGPSTPAKGNDPAPAKPADAAEQVMQELLQKINSV